HGVAVHPTLADERADQAIRLTTRVLPIHEVPQTTPPTAEDLPLLAGLTLDMKQLATIADGQFHATLAPLSSSYRAWIDDLHVRLSQHDPAFADHEQAAQLTVEHCATTLARIEAGIALLDQNADAAAAFRFANEAMYRQRIHAIYARQVRQGQTPEWAEIDKAENHSWRTFQLAFLLMNLPAMVDPTHAERSQLADLIWFPTGGGKTEAYLGVAALTLALRRLQPSLGGLASHAGIGVIMRYTLRLLTLQQFQRAAALICACEVIRREDVAKWGTEPFRIGLWVGRNTTPNRTKDADEAIKSARQPKGRPGGSGSPHQLTNCPWCGLPLDPGRDIEVEPVENGRGRTLVYCSDAKGHCAFGRKFADKEGLPVLTVDEEIYRLLPALLIATVDKFAQMPWNGRTAMLFGQVNGFCERHGYRSPELEDADYHPANKKYALPVARTLPMARLRPPDLIIQDELHLISGPLGSLVGLYETAVDRLCTWQLGEQQVQPKVIASTATIRQAGEQVQGLFLRNLNIFPPQGLDVEDSFFSRQRPTGDGPEALPGRRYIGINAPGIRHKTALIRTYTSLLSAAQALYEKYGLAADPWMTLVGYFNSLRELGGMRRAVDDSVSARLRSMNDRGQSKRTLTPYSVEELTSRLSATDIPEKLDQLEQQFDPDAKKLARSAKGKQQRPIDVLLATNMISVGVDIDRLGLMVCAGQPKTTSEYIQATSRVGRNKRGPGLVCVVYNWTRPRDLSHYESFGHYHATFYQHVEALSVTPFSVGAIKRGLSALLVSQIRLGDLSFNDNTGAENFTRNHPQVTAAIAGILARATDLTTPELLDLIQTSLDRRTNEWEQASQMQGARLGYRQSGDAAGLLSQPDGTLWQTFTCLNSLRDVEPTVNLVLDDFGMDREGSRPWLVGSVAAELDGDENG
ncbi:MAG TPA: DISARM system helicase DrmA, partial [Caldilineaceae bacterium]|nr:DISARM system helicase DrmA [Caldilineaceae bacterium]